MSTLALHSVSAAPWGDELLANIDFSALTAAQITALSTALRGDLLEDAFGLDLGYLLPL